jgi:D-amino-acid oxidase
MRVTVVGAGVVGLTTALVLAEHGHTVDVLAEELPAQTTSATAGAIWGPYRAGPAAAVDRWSVESLARFARLADYVDSGVRIAQGMEVARRYIDPPRWRHCLDHWRAFDAAEVPFGSVVGWRYSVPLINMPVYLEYLVRELAAVGVAVVQTKVQSLDEPGHGQVIVNCAGWGAGNLARDPTLVPVRGQQVIVANPGLTDFFMEDVGSSPDLVGIFPHDSRVVLGGTAIYGSSNRTVDLETARQIIARCSQVFPALASAPVVGHVVGIRPVREAVRLEPQSLPSGRWCVHNYGHGGAGVTLAWGCAQDAAALLTQLDG